MDLLDPRTLLLTITLLLAARAVILAYVWRVVPDYAPAVYWTAGSILIAVGALLAGLREIAPPGVSIVLAQSCIAPGWMLADAGTVIAAGRRVPWRTAIALLLALLPPLIWFTYPAPDYVARTVLTTLPAVLFDLYALAACLRATPGRSIVTLRILAFALAAMVGSNLWKMFGAASLQTTSLLNPGVPLIQFLMVSMVSFIVSTGLFVLLAAQWLQERLDHELAVRLQAESELKRHRDELEVLVRERTAELEERNAQLARTQFAMDRVGIGVAWNEIGSGRFIHVNDEACRQLGYEREELLRLTVYDIAPEVEMAVLANRLSTIHRHDESLRVETPLRRKDGSCYPVEVTAYLQRVDDMELLIGFFKDISERKAAEADLVTTKEAAEAASRAKSTFLANMGHELRTPMNAILGLCYLARHHSTDPALLGNLEQIDESANELLRIINNVLDIAEIESNRLQLTPARFRLPEVIEPAERLVAAQVAEKHLTLTIDVPPALIVETLYGDPLRLGQVVNCLLGNAVKFTEKGSITVTVTHQDAGDGTIQLDFEIADTGIGIDAADQARIFNAFEQGDMSRTRKYGGAGLGLAISRHLVRLMGGDMGVISTPGSGSRFWFSVRVQTVKA